MNTNDDYAERSRSRRTNRSTYLAKDVKIWAERIFTKPVAEISPETIAKILELLGRLSIFIDRASAPELSIFNAC